MKYLALIVVMFSGAFSVIAVALAGDCTITAGKDAATFLTGCQGDGGIKKTSEEGTGAIKEMAVRIAERAIALGALFAIGALVWSGIQYNSAFGDDERVKHAKNTMVFAIIGLVILLVSFPFVNIVVNFIYSFGE